MRGYAARFGGLSKPLADQAGEVFVERIDRGAFDRSLREGADVWALFAHQPDRVLGRRKSGTLRLRKDATGLVFELDLPDTDLGREVAELVRRGDIGGCSFGFVVRRDRWTLDGGRMVRTLLDVDLRGISLTPMPAYDGTSAVLVRAMVPAAIRRRRALEESLRREERFERAAAQGWLSGMQELGLVVCHRPIQTGEDR